MNTDEVLTLLAANRNARGMENWKKTDSELSSFGIGLTVLRKLAKKVGRDHELAQQLWQSDNYDARVLGLLIDEPKKLTREMAETQVEQLNHGMLRHVFSSCDATLAKTSFVVELCDEWTRSDDPIRRRCGYGLLYEISKDKRKSAPGDAYFLAHLDHMRAIQATESRRVRMAMGGAVMGIGKRNKMLNAACQVVATEFGPLEGEPGCDPFDVMKHLTSDYLTKKF
jgi:3-methyladenine DNA glycosylase AlkD